MKKLGFFLVLTALCTFGFTGCAAKKDTKKPVPPPSSTAPADEAPAADAAPADAAPADAADAPK